MCSDLVEEVEYDDAQIADGHSVHDPCRYSAADRQFRPACRGELARPRLSPSRAAPSCRPYRGSFRLAPKSNRALAGRPSPRRPDSHGNAVAAAHSRPKRHLVCDQMARRKSVLHSFGSASSALLLRWTGQRSTISPVIPRLLYCQRCPWPGNIDNSTLSIVVPNGAMCFICNYAPANSPHPAELTSPIRSSCRVFVIHRLFRSERGNPKIRIPDCTFTLCNYRTGDFGWKLGRDLAAHSTPNFFSNRPNIRTYSR